MASGSVPALQEARRTALPWHTVKQREAALCAAFTRKQRISILSWQRFHLLRPERAWEKLSLFRQSCRCVVFFYLSHFQKTNSWSFVVFFVLHYIPCFQKSYITYNSVCESCFIVLFIMVLSNWSSVFWGYSTCWTAILCILTVYLNWV